MISLKVLKIHNAIVIVLNVVTELRNLYILVILNKETFLGKVSYPTKIRVNDINSIISQSTHFT